jgi:hypothetical protein
LWFFLISYIIIRILISVLLFSIFPLVFYREASLYDQKTKEKKIMNRKKDALVAGRPTFSWATEEDQEKENGSAFGHFPSFSVTGLLPPQGATSRVLVFQGVS